MYFLGPCTKSQSQLLSASTHIFATVHRMLTYKLVAKNDQAIFLFVVYRCVYLKRHIQQLRETFETKTNIVSFRLKCTWYIGKQENFFSHSVVKAFQYIASLLSTKWKNLFMSVDMPKDNRKTILWEVCSRTIIAQNHATMPGKQATDKQRETKIRFSCVHLKPSTDLQIRTTAWYSPTNLCIQGDAEEPMWKPKHNCITVRISQLNERKFANNLYCSTVNSVKTNSRLCRTTLERLSWSSVDPMQKKVCSRQTALHILFG